MPKEKPSILVVDDDEDPKNMSGATPTWYAYYDPSDDLGDAVLSKTGGDIAIVNGNGTNDAIQFTVTDAESKLLSVGRYYHEAWADDGMGNEQPVCTGWMKIAPSPKGRA